MRYKTFFVLAVNTLVALPVAAQAQDKKIRVSFGGGFTVPNAEVKDHLGNGYNFNVGVETTVTPVIGIEGLYSFNGLGEKRISIPVSGTPGGAAVPTDFFASMNMQDGTANLVVRKPTGGVRPVRARWDGRLLPADRSDDAGGGFCARLLRSMVVRLLSGRLRFRRQCRRQTQLD